MKLWVLYYQQTRSLLLKSLQKRKLRGKLKERPRKRNKWWDLTIHPLRGPTSLLAFVPFFNRCRTPQSTSFEASIFVDTPPRVHPHLGSTSSLAHRSVSNSDTICNGPSLPLADIVLFGLSLSGLSSRWEEKAM